MSCNIPCLALVCFRNLRVLDTLRKTQFLPGNFHGCNATVTFFHTTAPRILQSLPPVFVSTVNAETWVKGCRLAGCILHAGPTSSCEVALHQPEV